MCGIVTPLKTDLNRNPGGPYGSYNPVAGRQVVRQGFLHEQGLTRLDSCQDKLLMAQCRRAYHQSLHVTRSERLRYGAGARTELACQLPGSLQVQIGNTHHVD